MTPGIICPKTANTQTGLTHNMDVSTGQGSFSTDYLHVATIYYYRRDYNRMDTDSPIPGGPGAQEWSKMYLWSAETYV